MSFVPLKNIPTGASVPAGNNGFGFPVTPNFGRKPTIVFLTQNVETVVFDTARFYVQAEGTVPFAYQWYKNGAPLSGATSASYKIENAEFEVGGSYSVRITNPIGTITSAVNLQIVDPAIVVNLPRSYNIELSSTYVEFTVDAVGTQPVTYQWRKNGVHIDSPTATLSTLVVMDELSGTGADLYARGQYDVIITSFNGTLTSSGIDLIINYKTESVFWKNFYFRPSFTTTGKVVTAISENFRDSMLSSLNIGPRFRLTTFELLLTGDYGGSINASDIYALSALNCSYTGISSLLVNGCSAMNFLDCSHNNLSSLDVSRLTNLTYVNCEYNPIETLNTSYCSGIKQLYCGYTNKLSSVDTAGLSSLTLLHAASGYLISLDLTENEKLKSLNVAYNSLSSLILSSCLGLSGLYCNNNTLSSLEVTSLTALTHIDCSVNKLRNLIIKNFPVLSAVNVNTNTSLSSVILSGCPTLKQAYFNTCRSLLTACVPNNSLAVLDVVGLSSIKIMSCQNNKLSSLVVDNFKTLEELYCYNNKLTALNVYSLTALNTLDCHNNNIPVLDVRGLSSIANVNCQNNQLTSLNIANLSSIALLNCRSNFLSSDVIDNILITLDQSNVTGGFLDFQSNSFLTSASIVNYASLKDKGWTVFGTGSMGWYGDYFLTGNSDVSYDMGTSPTFGYAKFINLNTGNNALYLTCDSVAWLNSLRVKVYSEDGDLLVNEIWTVPFAFETIGNSDKNPYLVEVFNSTETRSASSIQLAEVPYSGGAI